MKIIVITILVGCGLFVALRVLIQWQGARIANRLIDGGLHRERYAEKSPRKLYPESQFVVHLSDEAVSSERPDGRTERVAWDDLQRVEILTTPDGPFAPDTFWVLSGSSSGCVIPWGATGDGELLERLQRLPQFDNMAVINAAPKTEEAMTLCWQKLDPETPAADTLFAMRRKPAGVQERRENGAQR
jgi:hypothetical protein